MPSATSRSSTGSSCTTWRSPRCTTSWCDGSRRPWKTPGRPTGRASASAPTWQCGSPTRRAHEPTTGSTSGTRTSWCGTATLRRQHRTRRIQLLVEVTSEATFEADTTAKRVLYAAAGIPGYLVVHFDKDWARISEIEEYRLDWSKTVCGPGRTPPRAHPGRAVPLDRDVRRPPAPLNPAGFPVQVPGHIIYVPDLHLLVFRLRPTRETTGHRRRFKSLSDTNPCAWRDAAGLASSARFKDAAHRILFAAESRLPGDRGGVRRTSDRRVSKE